MWKIIQHGIAIIVGACLVSIVVGIIFGYIALLIVVFGRENAPVYGFLLPVALVAAYIIGRLWLEEFGLWRF